ncbi:CAP domain-containing protein [Triangularia verruculosa]|uniref:CAP domain-containing protein n=1 Tax=Triangularia verruculosa TaxID=2587418 RepID=A0AAN7AQT6_9PEZI|nr:CAP domain-containing protein [Triangularia verruculosa]
MAIEQEAVHSPLPAEEAELPTPPIIDGDEPTAASSETETPSETILIAASTPPPTAFSISAAPKPITVTPDVLAAFKLHNTARRSKNVPPLAYDISLEASARQWAQHLAKTVGKLQHATNTGQGENLYWASGGNFAKEPCTNATKSWLDEGRWYSGQKVGEPTRGVVGHYTQCMWSRTKRVGMAAVGDGKGGVYAVARYEGPGNFVGERPY